MAGQKFAAAFQKTILQPTYRQYRCNEGIFLIIGAWENPTIMRRYRGQCGGGSTVQLISYSSHALGGRGMGIGHYGLL